MSGDFGFESWGIEIGDIMGVDIQSLGLNLEGAHGGGEALDHR